MRGQAGAMQVMRYAQRALARIIDDLRGDQRDYGGIASQRSRDLVTAAANCQHGASVALDGHDRAALHRWNWPQLSAALESLNWPLR